MWSTLIVLQSLGDNQRMCHITLDVDVWQVMKSTIYLTWHSNWDVTALNRMFSVFNTKIYVQQPHTLCVDNWIMDFGNAQSSQGRFVTYFVTLISQIHENLPWGFFDAPFCAFFKRKIYIPTCIVSQYCQLNPCVLKLDISPITCLQLVYLRVSLHVGCLPTIFQWE